MAGINIIFAGKPICQFRYNLVELICCAPNKRRMLKYTNVNKNFRVDKRWLNIVENSLKTTVIHNGKTSQQYLENLSK